LLGGTVVCANVAVTLLAEFMVTGQVPLPLHAPPQPVNVEPPAALAVSVTGVPLLKLFEHVEPQLMPVGLDVTVPLPVPVLDTVSQ
jgi:hypothetical protein